MNKPLYKQNFSIQIERKLKFGVSAAEVEKKSKCTAIKINCKCNNT